MVASALVKIAITAIYLREAWRPAFRNWPLTPPARPEFRAHPAPGILFRAHTGPNVISGAGFMK
jgi:hypothetical protein